MDIRSIFVPPRGGRLFGTVAAVVVALAVARAILCAATPVFDTSEARYAAIAANMVRTGDYLLPHFTYRGEYQTYDGKPTLAFQCAAVSCRVFGIGDFAVRLPFLLAGALLLALMYRAVATLSGGDRRRAAVAVALTLSSTAFFALTGFCMPDALLTAAVAGALLCHALFLATGNRNWSLAVFALLAVGMLAKGPVAIVEFGLGALSDAIVNRRWRALRRYRIVAGTLLFLAICAPWFVLAERANPGCVRYFFVNENLLRFLVRDYGDKYGSGRETVRGIALVWAAAVTLPWSLRPAVAWCRRGAVLARFRRLLGERSAGSVLLHAIVAMALFWSCTSRVPIAYMIPCAPLAAAYCALRAGPSTLDALRSRLPLAAFATVAVTALALSAAMLFGDCMDGPSAPPRRNRYSGEFYHGPAAAGRQP